MIRVDFTVGRVVRLLREQLELSQEDLGMNKSSASKIELGKRNPRPETLEIIAKRLNVSVQEIHEFVDRLNSVSGSSIEATRSMTVSKQEIQQLCSDCIPEITTFAINTLTECCALLNNARNTKRNKHFNKTKGNDDGAHGKSRE